MSLAQGFKWSYVLYVPSTRIHESVPGLYGVAFEKGYSWRKRTGFAGIALGKWDFWWERASMSGLTSERRVYVRTYRFTLFGSWKWFGLWKLTGLSGLTSKKRFILRVHGSSPLDSRGWFEWGESVPICSAWLSSMELGLRERTGVACLTLEHGFYCGSLRVWSGLTSKKMFE